MRVTAKLQALKAGHALRMGGLLAHQTATLPGIAASAYSYQGVMNAQKFKQRKGPFLLIADSVSTALAQAIYITPSLRKLAKTSWPGSVTLVFKSKQHLSKPIYQRGMVAVRVDRDVQTRALAQQCGGLMLSSSLNRKGKAVEQPSIHLKYRLKRHLSKQLPSHQQAAGNPSKIFKVIGSKVHQLR